MLAGYDVLVMSSIMLESYSLLTREALAAGCVVITGDNPGPTEVVKDGVNGLVVPRGDATALGRAMRRIVTEPGLLNRLRPTPGALALRSLDDQLDGLTRHYTELVAARHAARQAAVVDHAALPAIRHVLIVSGITGAPLRYRGYLPQEALDTVGITADVHMYRDAAVPRKAREADAVIFYRVPATDQILDLISMIRSRPEPVPILFDVDDLIFDPGLRHELDPVLTKIPGMDLDLYWQGIRRYRTTLEAADAYVGSTEMLCDRVTELTGISSHRFADGVGRQLARACDFELYRPEGRPAADWVPVRDEHAQRGLGVRRAGNRGGAGCPTGRRAVDRRPAGVHRRVGAVQGPDPPVAAQAMAPTPRRAPRSGREPGTAGAGQDLQRSKSAIKWLEAALPGRPPWGARRSRFGRRSNTAGRACWPRASRSGPTSC